MKPSYTYEVVTCSGSGVWSQEYFRLRDAVARCRQTDSEAEVERILLLPSGNRRYWLWRRGRWQLYGQCPFDASKKDLAHWHGEVPA